MTEIEGFTWGYLSVVIEYIRIESVTVTRKAKTEIQREKKTATMQFPINKLYFVTEETLFFIVDVL